MSTEAGMWVGIKRCGCVVAAVVDRQENPDDVTEMKREFLADGLSVVYASWPEWQARYRPSFLGNCSHMVTA